MMGQIHENASLLTRKILAINNDDNISEAVRQDPLLVTFVNELSEKYTNPHQHAMIRSRVRMLGNILVKIREFNEGCFKNGRIHQKCNSVEVHTFADILDPRIYDNLIIAVQSIVGADAEKNDCKSPSTATTAGTWITKVAKLYEKELIKQLQLKNVEYFLKIHLAEFPIKISSLARSVQVKQKRNKQILLPTTQDINRFRDFVLKHLISSYDFLEDNFSFRTWKLLSQMSLIFILLFNRKRPGEMERVRIDDFQNAQKFAETSPEEYARLTEEDKKLADAYIRFEFGGKRGREVPLIMSDEMQKYVRRILMHRDAAKVHPNNPYIFGLPGFDGTRYKCLEACALMRRFSKLCNAEYPERLRATELRKHFATTVASLKIDECQIYNISNFMGHAETIHRTYYRQSVVTRDLCGVSKILKVASGVPSTIQQAPINPESMSNQSEASCSSSINFAPINILIDGMDSLDNGSNENTELVSSLNFTKDNESSDPDDMQFKTSKKRAPGRKRILESDLSSDDEFKVQNTAAKKVPKVSEQNERNFEAVGLKRNNVKTAWSEEERKLVLEKFSSCIKEMKVPPTTSIQELIRLHPIIQRRTLAQIRSFLHNQFARKLRALKNKN